MERSGGSTSGAAQDLVETPVGGGSSDGETELSPQPQENLSEEGATQHPARRPMNAFLLFCKKHRKQVRDKYPHLENRQVTKILGEWWADLVPNEKTGYQDLAKQLKEAFLRANPDFKWYKVPTQSPRPPPARPSNQKVPRHQPHPTTNSGITFGKLADENLMGKLSNLWCVSSCNNTSEPLVSPVQEHPSHLHHLGEGEASHFDKYIRQQESKYSPVSISVAASKVTTGPVSPTLSPSNSPEGPVSTRSRATSSQSTTVLKIPSYSAANSRATTAESAEDNIADKEGIAVNVLSALASSVVLSKSDKTNTSDPKMSVTSNSMQEHKLVTLNRLNSGLNIHSDVAKTVTSSGSITPQMPPKKRYTSTLMDINNVANMQQATNKSNLNNNDCSAANNNNNDKIVEKRKHTHWKKPPSLMSSSLMSSPLSSNVPSGHGSVPYSSPHDNHQPLNLTSSPQSSPQPTPLPRPHYTAPPTSSNFLHPLPSRAPPFVSSEEEQPLNLKVEVKVHKHKLLIDNMVTKIFTDPNYKGSPVVKKILSKYPQDSNSKVKNNHILQNLLKDLDNKNKNTNETDSNATSKKCVPVASSSPRSRDNASNRKVNSSPSSPILKTYSYRSSRGGTKSTSNSPNTRRMDIGSSNSSSNSNSPSRSLTSSPNVPMNMSTTLDNKQNTVVDYSVERTTPPSPHPPVSDIDTNVPISSSSNDVTEQKTVFESKKRVASNNYNRKMKQVAENSVSNLNLSASTSDNIANKLAASEASGRLTESATPSTAGDSNTSDSKSIDSNVNQSISKNSANKEEPPKEKTKTQELTEEYFNLLIHNTLTASYNKDEELQKYKKFCKSDRAVNALHGRDEAKDSDCLVRKAINSIESDEDEVTEVSAKRKEPHDGKDEANVTKKIRSRNIDSEVGRGASRKCKAKKYKKLFEEGMLVQPGRRGKIGNSKGISRHSEDSDDMECDVPSLPKVMRTSKAPEEVNSSEQRSTSHFISERDIVRNGPPHTSHLTSSGKATSGKRPNKLYQPDYFDLDAEIDALPDLSLDAFNERKKEAKRRATVKNGDAAPEENRLTKTEVHSNQLPRAPPTHHYSTDSMRSKALHHYESNHTNGGTSESSGPDHHMNTSTCSSEGSFSGEECIPGDTPLTGSQRRKARKQTITRHDPMTITNRAAVVDPSVLSSMGLKTLAEAAEKQQQKT